MTRSVELAPGILAAVSPDVSPATIAALRGMALELRHRELHGWLAGEPISIMDGVDYENRDVVCAACGARMPAAPWPTNCNAFQYRPRCGRCGSSMTYPAAEPAPTPAAPAAP